MSFPSKKRKVVCPPSNKKKKKKSSIHGCTLTDEVSREILSRLPAKVLVPWMLVCKKWLRMFRRDRSFIDMQVRRARSALVFDLWFVGHFELHLAFDDPVTITTTTTTVTTVTTMAPTSMTTTTKGTSTTTMSTTTATTAVPIPTFTFKEIFSGQPTWLSWEKEERTYSFVGGALNGLVCIHRYSGVEDNYGAFYMVNPATGQWATLPQCNLERPFGHRFSYDPFGEKYKIVYFSTGVDDSEDFRCEILTIGSRAWREIECPDLVSIFDDQPVVLERFLYWNPMMDIIISFDTGSEKFREISIPCGTTEIHHLFKMNDSLAFGSGDRETNKPYDIWILEDDSKGIWAKKFSIALDTYTLPVPFIGDYYPVASLNNGEIIFFKEVKRPRLFCYEHKHQRFREIMTNWKGEGLFLCVVDYASTLMSPHALL